MAPLRPWADLHQDVLIHIGDRLDLKCYASVRGVCRSWRGALAPPGPALFSVNEDDTMSMRRPSAASLTLRRSFYFAAIASGSRWVGSSNGWLALCIRVGRLDCGSSNRFTAFFLVNPVAGVEIPLPPLFYGSMWISKVVFAPCPAADDFTAVGICDADLIVYVTAGARRWAVLPPVPYGEHIVDLVYHDGERKVYCLTARGAVHVLHLPERRRRQKPDAAVQDQPKISVLRPSPRIGFSRPYPDVTLPVTIEPPYPGSGDDEDHIGHPASGFSSYHPRPRQGVAAAETIKSYWRTRSAEAKEPDLNAPARFEQLLPVDTATAAFAPPYDVVSEITSAKHLVLCEGNLYQVWRNTSCTIALRRPQYQHHRRVPLGEVFVLRYYPQRRPYWDVVKDLGGYSFFIGTNNAVSMYADGVPGLRGNCVYWIDGHAREKGMVFDMETGRSTPCGSTVGPAVNYDGPVYQRRRCFWYFLNDTVTTGQQQQR